MNYVKYKSYSTINIKSYLLDVITVDIEIKFLDLCMFYDIFIPLKKVYTIYILTLKISKNNNII